LLTCFGWLALYPNPIVCFDEAEIITRLGLMEVNDLGFVATILFVMVPALFLVILYIQTASREGNKS
jgi:photosystem II PsbM protein